MIKLCVLKCPFSLKSSMDLFPTLPLLIINRDFCFMLPLPKTDENYGSRYLLIQNLCRLCHCYPFEFSIIILFHVRQIYMYIKNYVFHKLSNLISFDQIMFLKMPIFTEKQHGFLSYATHLKKKYVLKCPFSLKSSMNLCLMLPI